jgi:thiamine pyrophosphokinase
MSSHHIVREKQEPALLVLGMDNFSDELLGQLLEWSPTVIVTETMAEKLNAAGIKVDWVIADIDNDIQSDINYLPLNDSSVIKTAFNFLTANNYPAVNVVTDELDITDYLPSWAQINLVIFHGHQKTYAVNSGFSKWKPAEEIINLLTNTENLRVTGLERINETSFKTTADGIFSIQFDGPFILIGETV